MVDESALCLRSRGAMPPVEWLGAVNEVAHAAMRGAIASMAMTGMRVVTVSLGLVEQAPPQQIAGESSGPRRAAVELAHWGFGAAAAAAFGALPSSWRQRAWSGPLYGLVIWSGFEATAPLLGLPHAEGLPSASDSRSPLTTPCMASSSTRAPRS